MLVDTGDGVTHVIPVYDGTELKHIKRLDVAGRNITEYLIKLLQLKGYAFNSTADFETVREIKEKFCFMSHDIDIDRQICKETTAYNVEHQLPDGTFITLDRERFEAPDIIFNPFAYGLEAPGVAEMVTESIQQCPVDCRKELYSSVLTSGGTSMFPGFSTRLANELEKLWLAGHSS